LGIVLVFGTVASVLSSAGTARTLSRSGTGPVLSLGTLLVAAALAVEAGAPSLWVIAGGSAVFGTGFGAIDSALNVHSAGHFGPRQANWMHASFGVGATIGPLLVTTLLSDGVGWRWVFGAFAVVLAVIAALFAIWRAAWDVAPPPRQTPGAPSGNDPPTDRSEACNKPPPVLLARTLTFTAVETGIESAAGIWGFIFLTVGHGLTGKGAGAAVSAYWAMMVVGRAVLGPVAERAGTRRTLSVAVVGVAAGAGLMSAPGGPALAVAGLMVLGLAAAPVFPLLTLTMSPPPGGTGGAGTARTVTPRTVSLQVAASAVGGTAVPSAVGVAIGALGPAVLAPLLLALAVTMCGLYGVMLASARQP
jgi:fucose permease